ncbi:hypothetical protein RRG08_018485 [Elysia crispata]|uniref:Uncharacterized protein n=1 Tax=Elysia crispata TaxID=231223 RepID=A0AAE1D491_9GAST|nr:hypothetical protein RRG08_018485 [Elysia crispata]
MNVRLASMELVVNRPVVSTVLGHRATVAISLEIVTEGVSQAISWGNVTKYAVSPHTVRTVAKTVATPV